MDFKYNLKVLSFKRYSYLNEFYNWSKTGLIKNLIMHPSFPSHYAANIRKFGPPMAYWTGEVKYIA